jgi:hypothetical protein
MRVFNQTPQEVFNRATRGKKRLFLAAAREGAFDSLVRAGRLVLEK